MVIYEPQPLQPWQQTVLDEIEQLNERLLRTFEAMERMPVDKRALAIARTNAESATLWMAKSVSPWPRLPDPTT